MNNYSDHREHWNISGRYASSQQTDRPKFYAQLPLVLQPFKRNLSTYKPQALYDVDHSDRHWIWKVDSFGVLLKFKFTGTR